MGRKSGTTNKSNYHYKVEEYENYHRDKLVRKAFFMTQKDIQEYYKMNRAAVYHTMNNNKKRIKKYNFLNIEKLNPPLPIHEKVVIDYSIKKLHEQAEQIQAEQIQESNSLSETDETDDSESWSE